MFYLRNKHDGRFYIGWDEKPMVFANDDELNDELEAPDLNGADPIDPEEWEKVPL